jgi:hypothetical protein
MWSEGHGVEGSAIELLKSMHGRSEPTDDAIKAAKKLIASECQPVAKK